MRGASEYSARRIGSSRLPKLRPGVSIKSVPVDVWALGALIVVAAVVRITTIDNQSFWADEALTAYEAHLPSGAMLNTVAHVETTPPLYFVLVWGWAHVFGTSEVALRSISTIAGIALVPITYLAARELVSRWAGVVAAAFVTVNPFLIWYSQEARSYVLLAALTGASFVWFARARSDPSRGNLGWWALCSSLAVMTHFFAGFLVAPEALWLLWTDRTRLVVIAVGVVAAAQVAMFPLAVTDTSHGPGWISKISPITRVSKTISEWGLGNLMRSVSKFEALGAGALLIAVFVLLLGSAAGREIRRGAGVAATIAGFVFLAPLALRLIGQDYFLSRNEIPAVVPVATALAAACVAPRMRKLGAALAVGLLVLFSGAAIYVQTHARFERPTWRNVARVLGPAPVPRAILVAGGTSANPLKVYLPHVNWVQPRDRKVLISEIDVLGAKKPLRLSKAARAVGTASLTPSKSRYGRLIPRAVAPHGARLLTRFRVDNWVVARFALRHPEWLTIDRLERLAPEYFLHTPKALNIFFQLPGG